MSSITGYLMGLVGVCLIASIVKQLLGISKHYKALGNTVIGIFLIFSIISPVVTANWDVESVLNTDFEDDFEQISLDANAYQQQALRQSIITQTEAYIWNKAQALSLEIEIEITLSESYPYAPCQICIWGNASPYAKNQLSNYLNEQIGIPKEAQTWMPAKS